MTLCSLIGLWCMLSGPARVIDGDTLVIGGTHVRLAGIDAEELSERHGMESRGALIQLIGPSEVSCTDTGERSYGRTVAVCWTAEQHTKSKEASLNAEMVRLGFALDCARYSGGKYRVLEPEGIRTILKQKPYC